MKMKKSSQPKNLGKESSRRKKKEIIFKLPNIHIGGGKK